MKTFRSVSLTRAPVRRETVDAASLERRLAAYLAFDLIGLLVVTSLAALVVLADGPTALRVVLGLPLIFFFPGYGLVSFLFPTRATIDGIERIAFAFGLSIAIIPPIALTLDRSRWSLTLEPVVGALTLVTGTLTVAAIIRRARIPAADRFAVVVKMPPIPPVASWDRQTKVAVILIGLAFTLLAAGGAPAVIARLTGQPTTEFAILNAAGEAQFYERQLTVGQPVAAVVSITNREGHSVTYDIRIAGEGVAVETPPPVTLADEESWTGQLRFTVNREGERLPVLVELRRDDQAATDPPYRTLRLMVNGAPIV